MRLVNSVIDSCRSKAYGNNAMQASNMYSASAPNKEVRTVIITANACRLVNQVYKSVILCS